MNPRLLAELTLLFEVEAFDADMRGESDEADRFWDIADELHVRFLNNDFEPPTLRDAR